MAAPKRRRRWLLAVGCALLLYLAGQAAWRRRPLGATEQQLVGVWALSESPDRPGDLDLVVEFRSDRVLLNGTGELALRDGTWSAADGVLTRAFHVPGPAVTWSPLYRTVPNYLGWGLRCGGRLRTTATVTFVSPDRFRTDVVTSHPMRGEPTLWWHRVPAPQAAPTP
jgi:hypothetical protein